MSALKEGVGVRRGDVHGWAKRLGVLLQDVEGLGRRDGAGIARGLEGGSLHLRGIQAER